MWSHIDTHPKGLARSTIPLTIVCGAPCSGKTTYVQQHKAERDLVIDLDLISLQLDPHYRPWQQTNYDLLRRAIRMRNLMLMRLAKLKDGRAWFIVSAPTDAERHWWQLRLGGELIVLFVKPEECKRRAIARGTPLAVQGVDDWFERSEQSWNQPQYRAGIAEDGWLLREAEDEDFCLRD